ncbi:alpha/beta hydrolase [Aquincola sp. MAHUQ-54]|uniref:Alpha/beta hydrolase n=1 Tax=Aquincola agrisoli TaxID=3119538 RepID=A0AAW9QMI5_9BURK
MKLSANGIAIEVDDQGPPGGPALLLVMGLGMQLIAWPQPLVDRLVGAGFRVIRIDNRDAGLSEGFDRHGVPNLAWAGLRYMMRLPVDAGYRLADMAADAWGVLDALGVGEAHLCGASMGGMIVQHMAAAQPRRAASLALMMTTSGARHLPRPTLAVQRALLSRPPRAEDAGAVAARLEAMFRLIGSPAYPASAETLRAQVAQALQRAYRPAGVARQLVAVVADGDRSGLLPRIAAPVHIVHGEADPLIPPAAARDLHAKLPGSTLDLVPGMGHDLPAELLARFAQGIATNAARQSTA